jgi:aspartyl/asparaginyl beta-hydroxylase (cupin superfamily)
MTPGATATAGATPQALNREGVQRLDAGDAAAAAALFARAAALDPGGLPLWMNLAKARRLLGDDAGEGEALARALAIDARDLGALIRSAERFERIGQPAKAMVAWSGVLAVAPPLAECSGAVRDAVAHGSGFVAARSADFARDIDAALVPARAAVPPPARRRADAAIAAATGQRRIYVNECAGLHVPFLPADEFFDAAHFPWFAGLEAHTPAIRAEALALLGHDGVRPYVSMEPGAPPNKWTPLDNSLDWGAYHLWQFGKVIPEAVARCPATAAALREVPQAELPGRAPTAFFSILKPRTRIPPHTGVSNTRTIVHLPLIVPPGCGFRVGGETRDWIEGEAFAFDDTIEHEAWNESDEPRVVLILDVWNPYLTAVEQRLLQEFYRAADASGHNPEGGA